MVLKSIAALLTRRKQTVLTAGCLACMMLILSSHASAAALSESESLRLGLAREAYRQLLDSGRDLAESELLAAKTWPNPELELSREELDGETETAVWLRQAFDLSGRRGLNRQSAEAAIAAARLAADASRARRGAEIRRQFHQTLYLQRKLELLGRWMKRFATVERSMIRRERAGDVSGYDRLRISRERDSLQANQREERVTYEADRWRLLGLLGLAESNFEVLEGELLPSDPPLLAEVIQGLQNQPGLLSLQRQNEADRLAVAAAGRARIPDLTLGLGHRSVDGPQGDASGLAVSAGFSIPLFDRGEARRQKADAQWRQSRSEYQLAELRARTEAERLWQQASRQLDNARLYRTQSLTYSHELLRIAETAYENNELGVLELIDAYRAALEADLTALRLALEARRSRIELDSLLAGVTP